MRLIYSILIYLSGLVPLCAGVEYAVVEGPDCEGESGVMQIVMTEACSAQPIALIHDRTNLHLGIGDSLRYIAHTSSDHTLGTVLAVLRDPVIRIEDGPMVCNQVYFVSAVVGQWVGGKINLMDSCLDVSVGQPIRFTCAPNVDAGPDRKECSLIFDVTGQSSNGTGQWHALDPQVVVSALVDETARVWVNVPGTYRLAFSSGQPPCIASDTVVIEVGEPPLYIDRQNVQKICNENKDSFYVSFDIFDGDAGTHMVLGAGSLHGGHFASDWLPAGSYYEFVVSDSSGCGTDTLSGYFECECLSRVGHLRDVHLRICDLDTLEAAMYYEPTGQVIAGNDIRNFLMTTSQDRPLDYIITRNRLGQFVFDGGQLNLSTTYYIFIVIGDELSPDLVDLDDPCLQIAGPVTVGWYETPKDARIEANSTEINCDFPEVRLHAATTNDTTGYAYEWTAIDSGFIAATDQGRATIHIATPGRYSVRFGHVQALCSAVDTIVITRSGDLPVVHTAQTDLITCYQDTVALSGMGSSTGDRFIYQWEGPGLIGDAHQLEVLANSTGLYALTVRDTVLDCRSIEKLMVEDDRTPPLTVADADNTLGCGTDRVIISATGSDFGLHFQYVWEVAGDTGHIARTIDQQHIEVDLPGTYRLSITNLLNGCTSSTESEVFVNENLIHSADLTIDQPSCEDGNDGRISVFNVQGGQRPLSYSIDGGLTFVMDSVLFPLDPGVYPVVIREETGCTHKDTVQLTAPYDFFVDVGPDQTIKFGEELTIIARTNLPDSLMQSAVWTPVLDSFAADQLVQRGFPPLGRQTYELAVRDLNGCLESDRVDVDVLFERRLYVPNAIRPNSAQMANRYLNLFADPIMVRAIHRFEVYNRWGQCVHKRGEMPVSLELDEDNAWDGFFNGQRAATGTYTYFAEVEFVNGRTEVVKGTCQLVQ